LINQYQETAVKIMSRTNFENLRVYRLSETLADEIWHIVLAWPVFARDTVGKLIVCSGDSIGLTTDY